jgi:hypothetical protein
MSPEALELAKLAQWAAPLLVTLIGGYAVLKKQTERHEKEIGEQREAFKVYLETHRIEEKQDAERARAESREDERIRRAEIEALSGRMDDKFMKFTAALTGVVGTSEEALRQARAAHVRADENEKAVAAAAVEQARMDEQIQFTKSIVAELKRTQELNLAEVRRTLEERVKA